MRHYSKKKQEKAGSNAFSLAVWLPTIAAIVKNDPSAADLHMEKPGNLERRLIYSKDDRAVKLGFLPKHALGFIMINQSIGWFNARDMDHLENMFRSKYNNRPGWLPHGKPRC